jgi:hypothetical protein
MRIINDNNMGHKKVGLSYTTKTVIKRDFGTS